jgi:nucleoside-diphosphate-sugar epimerase
LRILVTGASGFIGSRLVAAGLEARHTVEVLSRSINAGDGSLLSYRWSLGEPIPAAAVRLFDCVIHLAHDFNGSSGAQRTIAGTLDAIETFRRVGTPRQIFFSSLSARPDAESLYGRTKWEIETSVADKPDILVIRPGLVIGDGGIYGRIRRWARTFPIIPLPDGGRGRVRIIKIDDLCRETLDIMSRPAATRKVDLYEPLPTSLRDLVEAETKASGRWSVVLPIPAKLLVRLLVAAERLKLPLPVKADNLIGFLVNQTEVDGRAGLGHGRAT